MKKTLLGLATLISSGVAAQEPKTTQVIPVEVTEKGFVPSSIQVKPGATVTLEVTRKTDSTCATDIQVPALKIKKTELPLNKTVRIELGTLKSGEVKFGCGMNMMDSGKIIVN